MNYSDKINNNNIQYVQNDSVRNSKLLCRRGTHLGALIEPSAQIEPNSKPQNIDNDEIARRWKTNDAIQLKAYLIADIPQHQNDINSSEKLMEGTLESEHSIIELFDAEPYTSQLSPVFEMLASSEDESDQQEIETLEFDAYDGDKIIAENLWMKASWLSYEEDDASLRFRFSFGMVGYEDVANDLTRQIMAGKLTEALFPESSLITNNASLNTLLTSTLGIKNPLFVERIIYFNAPNGGAQFHQDVERGHLGVVFAQLSGSTAWLALSKTQLIIELQNFIHESKNTDALSQLITDPVEREALISSINDSDALSSLMDNAEENDNLELLLNRCPAFTKQLTENGYAYILHPGDIILLPQHDIDHCAWHSVFCLGETAGEGLSFAIREG